LSNSQRGFKDDASGTLAGDPTDDYQYDLNGNMIKDQNKKITYIVYNHLNLPTVINFSGGSNIVYTYDATGVKLKKIVEVVSPIGYSESKVASSTEPTNKAANTIAPPPPPPPPLTITTTTTTEYLNGFQYTNEVLQFFPTAEGYVKYTKKAIGGKKWILYSYIYNYTDHLGNIRLSYSKDPTTHETDVVEEQHYYPFGLEHPYNKIERDLIPTWNLTLTFGQTTENGYQYQYNGKEWQDELGYNMYDMDMRQYDPAIARWVVQDPIVHHGMSPYNAFDNNPVFWADPSGADAIYNESIGKYVINGDIVDFDTALAYANSGGNSDGRNDNTPKTNQSSDPSWKYNKIKNNYLNNGQLIIYSEMKAGKGSKRKRWKDLLGDDTCSIRLSYALNMSGYPIPSHITSQGRYTYTSNINSNFDYIIGADEMGNYLSQQLSGYHLIQSGIITSDSQLKDFMNEVESWKGLKGIVYVDANNHKEYGASGHVDLIYNDLFGDASFYSFGWYRDNDLDNYIENRFESELQISIWVLEGTK